MPDFIHDALNKYGLMELYRARPLYQQNDYIGWITRAKLETTRQKRLQQMLAKLEQADIYMNMKWKKTIHFLADIAPRKLKRL
ncbi:MAG TPA: YdeI/OmpD-associated family protein [Anaerolineales bacterium]|nr:YdeI/OmpD-associated family protein [Anaerolineales bacterium]